MATITLGGVVLVAIALLAVWGYTSPVEAQNDEPDCKDFDSQAEAQQALRDDPDDPDGLDGLPGPAFAGEEGVACEDYDYPQGSPRDEAPVNVDATGGSTSGGTTTPSPTPAPA